MSEPSAADKVFFSKESMAGILWMVMSKLVLFFAYFVISIIIVRSLGPEKYGVFSICKNIAGYLIPICALGLNTAILRFIPEMVANNNKAGIVRLLSKSLMLQIAAVTCATILLFVFRDSIARLFKAPLDGFMLLTGLMIVAQVGKNTVNDSLTAFYKTRIVAILSLVQGCLLATGLMIFLRLNSDVATVLCVEVTLLAVIVLAGFLFLWRHIARLNWRSPPYGIGRRRTIKLSGSVLLNTVARMLMLKYTEIFFLGFYYSPVIVGTYELGYSLPQMVITFIPTAIQTLFTSAFADSYTRDEDCLGRLISAFYKIIVMMSVPFTAFGIFFAPRAIVLVYGAEMAAAGPVASAFCLFHALPLISMPLSMALAAKEKIINMLPLLLFQVAVNLLLDILLIPRYGMTGALLAVFATFLLTIPVRLYVVYRLIGGLYFPTKFFMKMTVTLVLLAAMLSPLANYVGLAGLFATAFVYALIYLLAVKTFGLIALSDVEEFKLLEIPALDHALNYFTKR